MLDQAPHIPTAHAGGQVGGPGRFDSLAPHGSLTPAGRCPSRLQAIGGIRPTIFLFRSFFAEATKDGSVFLLRRGYEGWIGVRIHHGQDYHRPDPTGLTRTMSRTDKNSTQTKFAGQLLTGHLVMRGDAFQNRGKGSWFERAV